MSLVQAADLFAPVADGMAATERWLADMFRDEPESVRALLAHASRFGGKRLRPALVHLCGRAIGRTTDEHALLGAIVESLHLASLLHDDVLDAADTRRQTATLNALHGNEVPILLGDLIYARAFALSLTLSTPDASRELAAASQAIVRGEIDQSFFRFSGDLDEARYLQVIRDKTASLYAASCSLGVRYAGGTDVQVRALRAFGLDLGTAFQIIDDCLDVVGDEHVVGKSLGTDLETGKITLPVIRLARRLRGPQLARLDELLRGEVAGSRRDALRAEFDLDASVAECHAEANVHIARCVQAAGHLPEGPERTSLLTLCEFVLGRSH
jgi:octaprenyl-diphosphate synthase